MNKILITIAILVAIGVAVYIIVEYKIKKWSCVEGTCERVLNGEHSSLEKCQQQCTRQSFTRKHHKLEEIKKDRREKKKVTFSPNLVSYSPTPPSSYTF